MNRESLIIRRSMIFSILFAIVTGALLSCDSNPTRSVRDFTLEENLALSPREDRDAELLALYASNEIIAQEWLYQKIKNGLTALRLQYADSLADIVNIPVTFPTNIGSLENFMTMPAKAAIRNGTYNEWDSLNLLYRAEMYDSLAITISQTSVEYFWSYIRSEGRVNPFQLRKHYEKLEGIDGSHGNYKMGDESNVYVGSAQNRLAFIFRKAWGDCPSGCVSSHFYYFVQEDGTFTLVGDWLYDFTSEPPAWFLSAMDDIQGFRSQKDEAPLPAWVWRYLDGN